MRSMTAYGRATYESPRGQWVAEVHAVNRKHVEWALFLPKELLCLDKEVRQWLFPHFKRGQVTLRVFFARKNVAWVGTNRLQLLGELKKELEGICEKIGCSKEAITLPFLMEKAEAITALPVEDKELEGDLRTVVDLAVLQCIKMKEQEGSACAAVFTQELLTIEDLLCSIRQGAAGIGERYREKIIEKLQEFKQVLAEDQERVLREVFFYTEKVDVTEEIHRLISHIAQMRQFLASKEPGLGKTLDFLLQEMNREAHTLLVKSEDLDISYAALKIKAVIETMREQVQNIE